MKVLYLILLISIFSLTLGINNINAQATIAPLIPPIPDNPLGDLNNFDINETANNTENTIDNTILKVPVADKETDDAFVFSSNSTIWIWASIIILAAGGLYLLFQRRSPY